MSSYTPRAKGLTLREMALFAMLGSLMFCSKILMEVFPNIHLLGMFTMVFALCYGVKGLIPLYIYVVLNGVYAGFNLWWMPYLYIWTILWGLTMLLPRGMNTSVKAVVYPVLCGIHGLAFGILYAPAQALMFGMGFKQTVAWVMAGAPFDITHALGNLAAGFLVLPLCRLIGRIDKTAKKV